MHTCAQGPNPLRGDSTDVYTYGMYARIYSNGIWAEIADPYHTVRSHFLPAHHHHRLRGHRRRRAERAREIHTKYFRVKELRNSLSRDRPRFLVVVASSLPVLLEAAVEFSVSELPSIVLSVALSNAARLCSRMERSLDFCGAYKEDHGYPMMYECRSTLHAMYRVQRENQPSLACNWRTISRSHLCLCLPIRLSRRPSNQGRSS